MGRPPINFYRGLLSEQTMLPVGEAADENWNRFVDPEADKLMEEFVKTSDRRQTERDHEPDPDALRQRCSGPAALPGTGLVRVQYHALHRLADQG